MSGRHAADILGDIKKDALTDDCNITPIANRTVAEYMRAPHRAAHPGVGGTGKGRTSQVSNGHSQRTGEGFRRRPETRLFDLVLTLMMLPLTVSLFLLLALGVRCMFGLPILLRQQRPGLYGTPFILLNFRTMINARDEAGQLLPDSQ
jgi:hypothetical protein